MCGGDQERLHTRLVQVPGNIKGGPVPSDSGRLVDSRRQDPSRHAGRYAACAQLLYQQRIRANFASKTSDARWENEGGS